VAHYGNRFARTSNVKYIFSHVARVRHRPLPCEPLGHRRRDECHSRRRGAGPVTDTLPRLYWDTALSYRDPILRMLRDVVGLDQVLFRILFTACRN
jgi:6-methylsalicylate decarboxylase